jgi:hypothetical protein
LNLTRPAKSQIGESIPSTRAKCSSPSSQKILA